MAKSKFPSAIDMQKLKYGGALPEERDQMAARLREAGRRAEAILLFEGRGEEPFLREEAAWAIAEGNAFHLISIRDLGCPVADEELRACAEAAERRGRWMDARRCWQALGDEAALRRIAEHLPAGLRPEQEPNAEA